MNAKIYLSIDGSLIGEANVDAARYAEDCQNTEGHIIAECILDTDDLNRLHLSGDETIYALTK